MKSMFSARKGNASIVELIKTPLGMLISILLLLIAIISVRELLIGPGITVLAQQKFPLIGNLIFR